MFSRIYEVRASLVWADYSCLCDRHVSPSLADLQDMHGMTAQQYAQLEARQRHSSALPPSAVGDKRSGGASQSMKVGVRGSLRRMQRSQSLSDTMGMRELIIELV